MTTHSRLNRLAPAVDNGSGVLGVVRPNVQVQLNEFGQFVHVAAGASNRDIDRMLKRFATTASETDIAAKRFGGQEGLSWDSDLGFYVATHAGWVTNESRRAQSSSGGITTWLLLRLLELGMVDGVVHMRSLGGEGNPLFGYAISRTREEVLAGRKSKYYPGTLDSVLRNEVHWGKRYVLVGIPAVVSDVRRLALLDPRVEDLFPYAVGLICGHQKSTKFAESLAWQVGVLPPAMTDFDFRVKSMSGPAWDYTMSVTYRSGSGDVRVREFGQSEVVGSDWGHGYFKARFSDFTDDAFNETSDITVGDAWVHPYAADPLGTNVLVVRNHVLSGILTAGVESGDLHLDDVSADLIRASQRGLVTHTRREIGARRVFAACRSESLPPVRVRAVPLSPIRWMIQFTREQMALRSHVAYMRAYANNDCQAFVHSLDTYVRLYGVLYKVQRGFAKVRAKLSSAYSRTNRSNL